MSIVMHDGGRDDVKESGEEMERLKRQVQEGERTIADVTEKFGAYRQEKTQMVITLQQRWEEYDVCSYVIAHVM